MLARGFQHREADRAAAPRPRARRAATVGVLLFFRWRVESRAGRNLATSTREQSARTARCQPWRTHPKGPSRWPSERHALPFALDNQPRQRLHRRPTASAEFFAKAGRDIVALEPIDDPPDSWARTRFGRSAGFLAREDGSRRDFVAHQTITGTSAAMPRKEASLWPLFAVSSVARKVPWRPSTGF